MRSYFMLLSISMSSGGSKHSSKSQTTVVSNSSVRKYKCSGKRLQVSDR